MTGAAAAATAREGTRTGARYYVIMLGIDTVDIIDHVVSRRYYGEC